MPTNDERREVAARLRDWESFRETFIESPICAALDVLNVEGYLDWRGVCELLADLIEPEPERTCSYIERYDGYYNSYQCSECQYEMGGTDFEIYEPNRCMDCGAKITEVVKYDN